MFSIYLQEYAESAMNELLGWYGYSNNNEHSNNQQSSFMTYHKLSAMHATKMPKHAISQTSSLAATNLTSNGHRSSHKSSSTFDDFEANIDSRSSTDDSMNTSPNIITMATMQSNSTPSDKPHSGKINRNLKIYQINNLCILFFYRRLWMVQTFDSNWWAGVSHNTRRVKILH